MADPKVRFKRDDGSSFPAYQAKCLGDFFNERNERATGEEKLLAVTQSRGIVLQNDTDKRNVSNPDKSNYKVVRVGDIAYNTMRMWQGAEGVSVYDGIVSPAYTVVFSRAAIDVFYFEKYFKTNKMLKTFERYSQGLTSDTWNLKYPLFSKILVNVPCFEEQRKIADFLSSVDEVIAASEQEVANLETQKKAVMKNIFSQEVRFKKEDGTDFPEWENGCFGDLIEIYDERVTADCTLPVLTSSKQYGIQYQRDHFAKEQQHDITGYGVLPRGFCTYRNRSDGTDFTFNINYLCDRGIVSKFYPVFKATDKCVLYFLMTLLNNEPSTVKKISITAKGTGQKVLSFLDLQKISIPIPCLEEQRLIADFLSNFDEAIAEAKKELELWKELKKGLLQQMFV